MWERIRKRRGEGVPELNKRFIRQSLDVMILGLLKQQPMSGFEIIKFVHERFGILLSAGTVYPLLHFLKEEGLLNTIKEGKSIKYKIINKRRVDKILNEHIKTRKDLEKLIA